MSSSAPRQRRQQQSTQDNNNITSRTPVALASLNARERRKRELGKLKEENEKLKQERDKYLQHIDELQAKVNEMREQDGEMDVQLENDLLKVQLREHAAFVETLIHQAKYGPPAATLSPEHEKLKLYKQGADFATQQVLSLLTRSVKQSSEWSRARLNSKSSTPFAVSYQIIPDFVKTNMKRLNLRTDQVLQASAQDVLTTYFKLWTDTEVVKKFFSGSNFRPTSDRMCLTHDVTLLNDSLTSHNETLGALHIKERAENEAVDMLFAFSKKQVEVAHGTLVGTSLPCSLLEPWKRKPVTMLARSSQKQDEAAAASMNSLWVEGCLAWDIEDQPGQCRMTTIVSVPEDWVLFAQAIVFDEFIQNGCVSDKFLELTERFAKVFRDAADDAAAAAALFVVDEQGSSGNGNGNKRVRQR